MTQPQQLGVSVKVTPRCDALAREHQRLMAGPSHPGVVYDWIALAQALEHELSVERGQQQRMSKESSQGIDGNG